MSESHSTAQNPPSKPSDTHAAAAHGGAETGAATRPDTRSGTRAGKPAKPRANFPLFPHATGRWAKKIRGRLVYFGPWDDPEGAEQNYLTQKDDLHAGRTPRAVVEAATVKAIANKWLNAKLNRVKTGELSMLTFAKYREVCDLVVTSFGGRRLVSDLRPDDFAKLRNKMAKRWGALRVRDFIQHTRSIFKHALDAGLIATPVQFGPGFARPSRKTMRLERAKKGIRMFEAEELHRILDKAGQPLKAMILLGVNCGYGNSDCATLPLSALDLDGGWVNYFRPKTGISRRCPLWPETVEAIRGALAHRPTPRNDADAPLVFITKYGGTWQKKTATLPMEKGAKGPPAKKAEDSPLSKQMRKLLNEVGVHGNRNFYALRHTFETIGGEEKDQVAVDFIMGHARDDMASVYRERISDERLRAVVNHVRGWFLAGIAAAQADARTKAEERHQKRIA
jgi:integrase